MKKTSALAVAFLVTCSFLSITGTEHVVASLVSGVTDSVAISNHVTESNNLQDTVYQAMYAAINKLIELLRLLNNSNSEMKFWVSQIFI